MKITTDLIIKDRSLPSFKIAIDPDQSCRIFQQGIPLFFQNDNKLISCEPIIKRYKPGKRVVIQYHWKIRLSDGTEKEIYALGKLYNTDRPYRIYQNHEKIKKHLNEKNEKDFFPNYLGYIPYLRLLLQEYIEGKKLREFLLLNDASQQIKQIAELLAKLHQVQIQLPLLRTSKVELNHLKNIIDTLPESSRDLRSTLLNLFNRIEKMNKELNKEFYCLIHRDFHHEQVVFTQFGAILIDLDDICMGEASLDIGNFLAHLRLLSLELRNEVGSFEAYRTLFLSEYQKKSDRVLDTTRISFYETTTYMRLSCILTHKGKSRDWINQMTNYANSIL